MRDVTDDSQPAILRYGQADRHDTPSRSLEVFQSSTYSTQGTLHRDMHCTVHVFLARTDRPPFCLVPEQVRMKKTSIVRRKSRVRSLTPMVQCRAMDHGACGNADITIRATGATTSGMWRLRSISKQVSQHCSPRKPPTKKTIFIFCSVAFMISGAFAAMPRNEIQRSIL